MPANRPIPDKDLACPSVLHQFCNVTLHTSITGIVSGSTGLLSSLCGILSIGEFDVDDKEILSVCSFAQPSLYDPGTV